MEENKPKVMNNLEKILRNFHIYWNTLREKNEIDKARVDTKEIVKKLL
jgi:hypothetical protein